MMARKEDIVGKMRGGVQGACDRKGVAVVKGQGVVDGDAVVVDGTRYEYDHLVVATGTEPAGLPGIDMDHPAVLTSNDILVLPEVPETLLILGAGVIGCEFASLFQPLGVKVTMVEMLPRILAGIDNRTAKQFQKYLEKDGAEIHLGRRLEEVTSYSDAGVTVRLDDGTPVYLRNLGLRHAEPPVLARLLAREPVDPAEYYFRTAPVFDAPDGPHAWLRNRCFVGSARPGPGWVKIAVHLVT